MHHGVVREYRDHLLGEKDKAHHAHKHEYGRYQERNVHHLPTSLVVGAGVVVAQHRNDAGLKPEQRDEEEALNMLSMLADRTHQVYTGVAIIHGTSMKTFCECTDVTFYPVDRQDLLRYIASGDPMDKAGAYGIQGDFAIHVKEIHGDYNNVVGLPVARLYQELKKDMLV